MCTCITFCWTTQLFNTTFDGPTVIGRTTVICICITICWTRHFFLINYALIGPFPFGRRELFILLLHSTRPDSYLTQL